MLLPFVRLTKIVGASASIPLLNGKKSEFSNVVYGLLSMAIPVCVSTLSPYPGKCT